MAQNGPGGVTNNIRTISSHTVSENCIFFIPKKSIPFCQIINVKCKQNDHPANGFQDWLIPHVQVDEGCRITILAGNTIYFIAHL